MKWINYRDLERYSRLEFEARAKEILPFVANEAGVGQGDLRKRFRGIRLVPNVDVNAITKILSSDSNETFTIEIYAGLLVYYLGMSLVFSSRLGIREENGEIKLSGIPHDKTIEQAKELIHAFWKSPEEQRRVWRQQIVYSDLNDEQKKYSSILIRNAERFTVAHELGHVLIGMINPNHKYATLLDFTRDFLCSIPKVQSNWVENWTTELTCDLVGLALSFKCCKNPRERWLMYTGAEWNLLVLQMLEAFSWKQTGQPYKSSTHPPAAWRRGWLRETGKRDNPNIPPDYYYLADILEQITQRIYRHL